MEEEEIKIELEKSAYLRERQRLWQLYETPTISQARINLGEELATLIFELCEKALVKEFGLTPPLQGPGDILWSSPSDLLLQKLALKPPFTPKCLQALTHECILDIGYGIEAKFRHELELEMQKALEKQKLELQRDMDDQLRYEIKDVEIRERFNCQLKVEKLMQEFEQILIDELGKLEKRLRAEYQYVVKTHEQKLREKWQINLDQEIQDTIEVMSDIFFQKLQEQEEVLSKNFKLELKKREIQKNVDIKLEEQKFKCALKHLRHSLECRNIANMMYVLCMERRKCCEEKQTLETHYKEEIKKMQDMLAEKSEKIKELTTEKDRALNDVRLREMCLTEILKQYQKFISFALRAAPTQAEFLLSIEKMMIFELGEAVKKSEFTRYCSSHNFLPWSHGEPPCPSEVSDIILDDFHNCYKILNPPLPDDASELGPDDYLPAVYYKTKMYMREDFRNMLSQGIEMTPSNELWNKDVEILLETMRSLTSVKSDGKEVRSDSKLIKPALKDWSRMQESHASFESGNDHIIEIKGVDKKIDVKKYSVPLVVFDKMVPNKESTRASKLTRASRRTSRDSFGIATLKPIDCEPGINYSKIGEHERHKSIISARDSLEIIRDRSSIKKSISLSGEVHRPSDGGGVNGETDKSEQQSALIESFTRTMEMQYPSFDIGRPSEKIPDEFVKANDSIILRRTSLVRKSAEFNASPKDSVELIRDSQLTVKRKPSKLSTARNSLEILRESVMKIKEPLHECPKNRQSLLNTPKATDFCCDKCYGAKDGDDKGFKTKASQEVEVTDGIIKEHAVFTQDSDHDKCVKMSHIEVYHVDEETKNLSNVMFVSPPVIYDEKPRPEVADDGSRKRYRKKSARKRQLSKPTPTPREEVRIAGDIHGNEGYQQTDEFTVDRIHSFVGLIKDHPNLIRMFTSGQ